MTKTKTWNRTQYRGLPVHERFLKYIEILPSGCHLWLGAKVRGYGYFWNGERLQRAARYSLERKLGRPIKPKMHACHTCDVSDCVNPQHLYEGTAKQNVQDCISRGRRGNPAGRGSSQRRVVEQGITPTVIRRVEKYLRSHTRQETSLRFGLSVSTVRKIDLGEHWSQKAQDEE